MFEAALEAKLKKVFDFDKCTFDLPGESQEQEVMFIDVESSRHDISDGNQRAKVTGKIRVYSNNDKLPFGYFAKKIRQAAFSDTADIFFYEFEENTRTFRNICERSMSFVYFFSSQYNPPIGTIEGITIDEV